ncbi:hypothetical protein OS176_00050 [Xanthomonadaceae bacterium XH05]|nr:hypothetical protein [Xanthomonadaceae bacterium XH05]
MAPDGRGIGRRGFLKAFGAVIASSGVAPFEPVISEGGCYINRCFGLAFRPPVGWRYIDQRDFPRLREAQIVEEGPISERLLSAADPYVVMAKSGSSIPDALEASMTAYAEDFAFLEGESLEALPSMVARTLEKVLLEYELIAQGAVHEISGVDSIEYLSGFRLVTSDLEAAARCRTVLSVRRGAIFTFNFFDYPDSGVDARSDFDQMIGSLAYA